MVCMCVICVCIFFRVSNNLVPWWLQYLYSRVSPEPLPLLPLLQGVSNTFTPGCLQYLYLLCLYFRVSPISVPLLLLLQGSPIPVHPLPLLQGVSNTNTSSAFTLGRVFNTFTSYGFTPGCLQYYEQGCDPGCLQYYAQGWDPG